MWHVFERAYDKKDHLIKHIMKLIDTADDQFQRTVASFCVIIDGMINKFLTDLDDLSKENDIRTAALLKRGEDDVANIMRDHEAAETHLQLLLYHSHTSADAAAWTVRGENLVKQDEDRSKFENDRENLRSYLENVYNATWEEYKSVLRAYVLDTAENQKQLRKLRRKETVMSDIIASQGKKIANSDGLLKRLRSELAAYESGTKQAVFRDRRDRHRNACLTLKKNMYNGVETDMRQMARLVRVSDDAVEWLQAAFSKVERILRMAALCRKFETRREKVLPYGSCPPQSPMQAKLSVRQQMSDESLIVHAMSANTGLTRLWHRISKAELTKRALYREKMLLEKENAFIISRLEANDEKEISLGTQNCKCTSTSRIASITVIKAPVIEAKNASASKMSSNSIANSQLHEDII
ncbi:unnamed protein product [Arctia plantaginis]|nr:unnamed protein product [Arctia plantaginis]